MNPSQRTTPAFDRGTEDIGNIVEFGHLNLRVPDQQMAIVFYVTGLGLTRDPYLMTGVDNAWINAGTSQFHLPTGPAQALRGVSGLVMQDLDALVSRLEGIAPGLKDTRFSFERMGQGVVEVSSPWGHRLRVHAPDESRFGRMLLGMPYVEIDAAPGTVQRIARFYAEVLGARPQSGEDAAGAYVRVPAGLAESLVFRETRRELPRYDGHHVQISVADFSGVHRRLLDRGLITEESNQSQYRFEHIVDLESGEVLATIEHEVRSMRHPMYGRPLVNRNPAITNDNYGAGHEAAVRCMPPR